MAFYFEIVLVDMDSLDEAEELNDNDDASEE